MTSRLRASSLEIASLAMFLVILAAASAAASNIAFEWTYDLTYSASSQWNFNLISLPYLYYPNGQMGATPQTALDLCTELNGAPGSTSKVLRVLRYRGDDTWTYKNCASTTVKGFNLKVGEGYIAMTVRGPSTTTVRLIGAHDDAYSPNKGGTKTVTLTYFGVGFYNHNFISVPYHVRAENAIDLCTMLNGAPGSTKKVIRIFRIDTASDTWPFKNCASTTFVGFDLKPGEGYSFIPASFPATQEIAFDVY